MDKQPSMKEISFRIGSEKDRDFIRQLSARVFSMFGDYDLILTQWFMQPGVITVIGSKNGKPVGFAMLQLGNQRTGNALTGELLAIAVIPEQQSQGVGWALLHQVEDMVFGVRLRAISLHTVKDNLPARFLFQKAGYRIAGSKEGYYPKGQAAVRMVKVRDL